MTVSIFESKTDWAISIILVGVITGVTVSIVSTLIERKYDASALEELCLE